MKNKITTMKVTEHLHFGHLAIIVGCIVFLVGSMVMKNGWSLSSMTARADQEGTEEISYEEIKSKVAAESGVVLENTSTKAEETVAMLDPAAQAGKVLGESIGFKVAEPTEIANDPRFQDIKVLTISGMTKSDIQHYGAEVVRIEADNSSTLMLAYLNTEDPVALEQAMLNASAIATLLEEVYVPVQLERYHKMKIIYYRSIEQIARNFSQREPTETLQQATSDMFSAINAMSPVRTTIYSRYQVDI